MYLPLLDNRKSGQECVCDDMSMMNCLLVFPDIQEHWNIIYATTYHENTHAHTHSLSICFAESILHSLSEQFFVHHCSSNRLLDSLVDLPHAVSQPGVRGQQASAFECLRKTRTHIAILLIFQILNCWTDKLFSEQQMNNLCLKILVHIQSWTTCPGSDNII